jgi:hypothetical protein
MLPLPPLLLPPFLPTRLLLGFALGWIGRGRADAGIALSRDAERP